MKRRVAILSILSSILALFFKKNWVFNNKKYLSKEWQDAKAFFYSEVSSDIFTFIDIGEWIGYSPVNKGIEGSIVEVHTVYCPKRMNYFEYIEFSRHWIDWARADKIISESLLKGSIVKIHFKFDGTKSTVSTVFSDHSSYLARDISFFKSSDMKYPGVTKLYLASKSKC